jgi:hypothetical protein
MEDPTPGVVEAQIPARFAADPPSPLVNSTVMAATERHDIVEIGCSPVGPMVDVVGV